MELYAPLDPDPGRSRGFQSGHDGIDYNAVYQPVLASGDGHVTSTRNEPSGYGQLIDLGHADGWMTRYAHLSEVHVLPGDGVAAGQVIGITGNTGSSTGPHMHFETRQGNVPIDPDQVLRPGRPHGPAPDLEDEMRSMFVHAPGSTEIWLYDPANGTKTLQTPATFEGAKALAPVTGLKVDGPHNGTFEADPGFIRDLVEIG